MPDKQKKSPAEKKDKVVKDSFLDDLAYVAKETISPTADPKNDPVPGEKDAEK